MLTAEQLRAARAVKRWDQSDIAARSGVSVETIKRLEKMDGRLTTTRVATIDALRQAYEAAGVIFVAENGEGPGVRLRKAAASQAATEADKQASAAVVRARAADAVDEALIGSGATMEEKAERRGALTDEPAVIGSARGKGHSKA